MFTRRPELDPAPARRSFHTGVGEEVVCDPQLFARVEPTAFASQPLAVKQPSASEVHPEPCRLEAVDPTPYFAKYGENVWAGVKGYLDALADTAAAPVIEKYKDLLAAADVFTASTAFWVMESIRLDLSYASYVHP